MFSLSEINRKFVIGRRLMFFSVILLLLSLAAIPMSSLLAEEGWTLLEIILLVLFILLLAQVVFGFTLAAAGYWQLKGGRDRVRINNTLPPDAPLKGLPATAIVMPIFNEEVGRLFQGLLVMWESLQKTGHGEVCDFFILSDSNDSNLWIAEETAWLELCKRLQGFGRIFYRKRRIALHNKSGNIADFCRRWGAKYRYMIVLDADSVVTGSALVRLICLMEQNPRVGIIQTSPKSVLGKSLFQRIMQFGASVYGPIFTAGANFWQLNSATFWGHNAIVRLKPFMKYCAMPELPKTSRLGTHILSHDTIESALMLRGGYGVWLAYDLEGSYEEGPPHLPASMQRDRRWCFGNLQHLSLLFAPGLKSASRIHILHGIMSYAGSFFWLLFLLLSTFLTLRGGTTNVSAADASFSSEIQARILFTYVMGLLLLPKALGLSLAFQSPAKREALGGGGKAIVSALAETLFAVILAPILMLFYTRFVWDSLTGRAAKWSGQKRDADETPSWRELASFHLGHTVIMAAWAGLVAILKPSFLPWMTPIFLGPIVSLPFSRLTASNAVGQWAREKGWFVIPEETQPPPELQKVQEAFTVPASPFFQDKRYSSDYGLLQAVLDPLVNALHVSLLHQRPHVSVRTREYMNALSERLLRDGPLALTPQEKRILLWDADTVMRLHRKLWSHPDPHLDEWWQAAFRHYNEASALSIRRAVTGR